MHNRKNIHNNKFNLGTSETYNKIHLVIKKYSIFLNIFKSF